MKPTESQQVSRRRLLQLMGLGALGLSAAACQPIQPLINGATSAAA